MKKIAKSEIVYNVNELSILTAEVLGEIKALIEKNEFVYDSKRFEKYLKLDYKTHLNIASKRTLKRLNKQIRFWTLKSNRHSANRFLHFLRTRLTATRKDVKHGSDYYSYTTTSWESVLEPVKIKPSVKEQLIQKKREVWKKLRDEAEKARLDYNKEKGDFYKARLYEKDLVMA